MLKRILLLLILSLMAQAVFAQCRGGSLVYNPISRTLDCINTGTVTSATVQDGSLLYCADAGASDAYACNLSPAITSYTTGACYAFKANTANTGAASLTLNSIGGGAKTIVKVAGGVTTALDTNDIRVGQVVEVCYDGTNFQMQSILGNAPTTSGAAGGALGGTYPNPTLLWPITFAVGDTAGSAIAAGKEAWWRAPFACTLGAWSAGADASGSIEIEIWKDTHANFPPTVADKITATDPIAIVTATKAEDTAPTGWTTAVSAGDWLLFHVNSATTVKQVTVVVQCTR